MNNRKRHRDKLTRRGFLARGATAAVGAAVAPCVITSAALGTGSIPAASERVTLGHIGVGGQGTALVRYGFLPLNDAQCVAVCDPFRSRRENVGRQINEHYAERGGKGSYKGCAAYNDFRELSARDDIDAVVIATPDHWHVLTALAAARAGKDLYVEKPLGLSLAEDQSLRDTVNRHGTVFQYGTQQRSSPNFRFACELVRNGRIGKLHTIEATCEGSAEGGSTEPIPVPEGFDYDLWLGPAPWAPLTYDRCIARDYLKKGGWYISDYALGFIAGWGAHPLDIAQWGNGTDHTSPIEYEGTGTFPTEGLFDTAVSWDIWCRYANGVSLHFRSGVHSTKFIGTEGWVKVNRNGIWTDPPSLLKSVIGPGEIHLYESRNHYQNFLDCIRTRSATISPIEPAVRSDTISHLSDIAIRTGRRITWDPEKEKIIGDPEASRLLGRSHREPWHL